MQLLLISTLIKRENWPWISSRTQNDWKWINHSSYPKQQKEKMSNILESFFYLFIYFIFFSCVNLKGCLVNSKQMLTWLEFDAQQQRWSYRKRTPIKIPFLILPWRVIWTVLWTVHLQINWLWRFKAHMKHNGRGNVCFTPKYCTFWGCTWTV